MLCSFKLAIAQQYFKYNDSLRVFDQNNIELDLPWLGGLNNPQYSSIDVNQDNIDDLLIFDRYARKSLVILRNKSGQYRRDYYQEQWFPDQKYWMLSRDYNDDGKSDLFMGHNLGISLYENISQDGQLRFKQKAEVVKYQGSTTMINIYCTTTDIPVIDDVDKDGDIDILTFGVLGGKVDYYENIVSSQSKDTFEYQKSSSCWGGFKESNTTNTLELQACGNRLLNGSRHAGSTLTLFKGNTDEAWDLLVGDVSYSNLVYLENGGTNEAADMISQMVNWPNENYPVKLDVFPAAYRLDVDLDGDEDILVSYNSSTFDGRQSTWLYLYNNGHYQFQKKDFLQDISLDFGVHSSPVFFDENNDGLMDLLVAFDTYHDTSMQKTSSIALLQNIGDEQNPVLKLKTRDWQNFSKYKYKEIDLSVADINSDNQAEIIIGDYQGRIHVFNFQGDSLILAHENFMNINVNYNACPTWHDIDDDGDLDLFIGERKGKIQFYRNDIDSFRLVTPSFGNIDTKSSDSFYGYSDPAFYNYNGTSYLLVGSKSGSIFSFIINGEYVIENGNQFSDIKVGQRAAMNLGDINNDGNMELIVGNSRGGLSYYTSSHSRPNVPVSINHKFSEIKVYPNPFDTYIKVEAAFKNLILYDQYYQKVKTSKISSISTLDLNSGLYFLEIEYFDGQKQVKKLIKY